MSLEGKSAEEIAALAALADDVLGNPKTAGTFQRLVKANNPGVSMPMVELEDRAAAAFKQRDDEIGTLKAKLAQQEAERGANSLYEALREHGSCGSRNDFQELVTFAATNGYQTTESGLKRAAQQRSQEREAALPTPVTVGNGLFRVGDNTDESKKFFANPMQHSRTVAAQAMDELAKMRSKGNRAH